MIILLQLILITFPESSLAYELPAGIAGINKTLERATTVDKNVCDLNASGPIPAPATLPPKMGNETSCKGGKKKCYDDCKGPAIGKNLGDVAKATPGTLGRQDITNFSSDSLTEYDKCCTECDENCQK